MKNRPIKLLVTCEHAGNQVPVRYRPLFAAHQALLDTHRGYDPGALSLARAMARQLDAVLLCHRITRLLVEPNRSPRHPALFSTITRDLPESERKHILARYYTPHRKRVHQTVTGLTDKGYQVIHVGVHTFTPVLDGQTRRADIGLLYDPARSREQAFSHRWRQSMRQHQPQCQVRMNCPYRGTADGLTTWLRRRLDIALYLGIELEVNQALRIPGTDRFAWPLVALIVQSLLACGLKGRVARIKTGSSLP